MLNRTPSLNRTAVPQAKRKHVKRRWLLMFLRTALSVMGWLILGVSAMWLVWAFSQPMLRDSVAILLVLQTIGTLGMTIALTVYEIDKVRLQRVESKREETEARYNALFGSVGEAVFIVGLDGVNLSANQAALNMLKIERQDLEGTPSGNQIAEEERKSALNVLERLKAGEIMPIYQRKFITSEGEKRVGEVSATLVRDKNGTPLHIQSIVRDVTDRLKADKERIDLTVQKERNALLNQLIADFSHHVRTPLANVKNSNYLMMRFKTEPERIMQQNRIIDVEIARMTTLLDNLITLTRLELEETETTVVGVPVNALLYGLLPQPIGLSPLDDAHTWEYTPDMMNPHVFGSHTRLSEAFKHLVENAKQYTPKNKTIRVMVRAMNNIVMVQVQDEGIGIAQDDLDHIFENFYRTDDARLVNHTNGGLGLTIAKRIIEIHRGIINVESELHKGSIFEVFLPTTRTGTVDPMQYLHKVNRVDSQFDAF